MGPRLPFWVDCCPDHRHYATLQGSPAACPQLVAGEAGPWVLVLQTAPGPAAAQH
jgi:hypothetical protein